MLTLSLLLSKEGFNHLKLADQNFIMKIESYDIYDSKGKVLRLYKEVNNGEKKQLLSFTLNDTSGPCHEKSVEDGSYEIDGSTITFYTLWDRYGSAEAPYGARIKTYSVDTHGELKLLSSKIYIETERKDDMKESAMQYLFKNPETKSEKKALQQYIENAERRFKGTFVFGEEAKLLIKEVNEALFRKSQKRWH